MNVTVYAVFAILCLVLVLRSILRTRRSHLNRPSLPHDFLSSPCKSVLWS